MADSFIEVSEGVGKKLDTEELTVGLNSVHRERVQVAGGDAADDLAVVTDTDPAAGDHGLVVRDAPPDSPQTSRDSASVAGAGGTASLDSTQLSASVTGKLVAFVVSGQQPWEADLVTVQDGTESGVIMTVNGVGAQMFPMPHKDFVTVAFSAGAGFDGFRLNVTNRDTGATADDIFATFFWDEV